MIRNHIDLPDLFAGGRGFAKTFPERHLQWEVTKEAGYAGESTMGKGQSSCTGIPHAPRFQRKKCYKIPIH